jgi:hypothetical protein
MRVAEHDFLARLSDAQGIFAQSLCTRGAELLVVGFILSLSFNARIANAVAGTLVTLRRFWVFSHGNSSA